VCEDIGEYCSGALLFASLTLALPRRLRTPLGITPLGVVTVAAAAVTPELLLTASNSLPGDDVLIGRMDLLLLCLLLLLVELAAVARPLLLMCC
jgi:hypothetical protein